MRNWPEFYRRRRRCLCFSNTMHLKIMENSREECAPYVNMDTGYAMRLLGKQSRWNSSREGIGQFGQGHVLQRNAHPHFIEFSVLFFTILRSNPESSLTKILFKDRD